MEETILKLMAEGGSITLVGIRDTSGIHQFRIKKNEVVFYDLALESELLGRSVAASGFAYSWNDAISLLNRHTFWHCLYPVIIHPDFKVQILELVEARGGATAVGRWLNTLD
jgi:hypothetical protein